MAGSSSGAGILGSPTAVQAQLQRWCFAKAGLEKADAHHQANTAAELLASEKHNLNVSICVYVILYVHMGFNICIYIGIYTQSKLYGFVTKL